MADAQPVSEVDAEIAGQKLSIKSGNLNTIATVATLLVVCVASAYGYTHVQDSRDGSRELVTAIKEMTQVAREANCINAMPPDRRDPDICRRISR